MNSEKAWLVNKDRKITLLEIAFSKITDRNFAVLKLLAVNMLTGSRVVMGAGLLLCILSGAPGRALALLAVIFGTDIMDGMLARRWHVQTRTGAYFDLAADIWFVVFSCSALVITGLMPFWFLLAAACKFAEFAATSYFLSGREGRHVQSCMNQLPTGSRSPVFDAIGRFSGILFMSAPVPAIVLYRIMPFQAASLLFTGLAACICMLSLISSCYRIYLCASEKYGANGAVRIGQEYQTAVSDDIK